MSNYNHRKCNIKHLVALSTFSKTILIAKKHQGKVPISRRPLHLLQKEIIYRVWEVCLDLLSLEGLCCCPWSEDTLSSGSPTGAHSFICNGIWRPYQGITEKLSMHYPTQVTLQIATLWNLHKPQTGCTMAVLEKMGKNAWYNPFHSPLLSSVHLTKSI